MDISFLLLVQNDIFYNMDKKRGEFLFLLDLSAAFDIIDYRVLLSHLSLFGVRDSALEWMDPLLFD